MEAAEAASLLKSPITTSLMVVSAVFEALATFVVALRFYLRLRRSNHDIQWDDWLVLLSLVSGTTEILFTMMLTFIYRLQAGDMA